MRKALYRKPFFLFLLPVFFVWHGYGENLGLITLWDCLLLLGTYLLMAICMYGLLYLLYRNTTRAAILATLLLSVYFFFGALHDFLKTHTRIWHRYSVLLPLLLAVIFFIAVYLKRSKAEFSRVNFYCNLLLIIYLLTDAGQLVWRISHPVGNQYAIAGVGTYKPCTTCNKPDIYFFIFDEYSSTVSLSETFKYNNTSLDSFFVKKGFRVLSHSFSNYNFTPFSVASILNMGYIQGIHDAHNIAGEDYENAERLISKNAVVDFVTAAGYDFVNFSVFDMAISPSPVEESFLPLKTKLITRQTLFARLRHDIGWHLAPEKLNMPWVNNNAIYNNLNNNNKQLKLLTNEINRQSMRPRFVYTHFEMPHWPFYFDKSGRLRDIPQLQASLNMVDVKGYTEYLTYINKKMQELVDTIQSKTRGEACIIIMGDHGYRVHLNGIPDTHVFKNLNAIYFPSKDYRLFSDTISGVNQFRVVFNTLFKQSLPILKDSATYLNDKN